MSTADLSEVRQARRCCGDYRTCFILFHQQELSCQEIAEALNCPEGTVKTWLHRARKRISAGTHASGRDRGWI
ncbi:MAG: sigma-70 region 4 domain-containing protein [Planctomycetaceae bacterium]